jgi:hypothetical protein
MASAGGGRVESAQGCRTAAATLAQQHGGEVIGPDLGLAVPDGPGRA